MHVSRRTAAGNSCISCHREQDDCHCAAIVPLATRTRLLLILHGRESRRRLFRAGLALRALKNSEMRRYGERDAQLDLSDICSEQHQVFILSSEAEAPPLSSRLISDERPVTVVVYEGTRPLGSRLKRIRGLEHALVVRAPLQPMQVRVDGYEQICRAFAVIESQEIERELRKIADQTWVEQDIDRKAETNTARCKTDSTRLPLLYRDDQLVAVNKPAGMLTHRGWGDDVMPLLQRLRDETGQYLYPVHRLDRATSGVVVFATSAEMVRLLQEQFNTDQVKKEYLALCRGHTLASQVLHYPLAKEKGGPKRAAVTELALLESFERYGLVRAIPKTGRTHQIRRHLKHLSHPIIGDVRYGKGEHNRIFRERFNFHRLALHAQRLSFIHPITRHPLTIEAPLDAEFSRVLSELGLLVRAEPERPAQAAAPVEQMAVSG